MNNKRSPLKLTSPENWPSQKENSIPTIFRCELFVSGRLNHISPSRENAFLGLRIPLIKTSLWGVFLFFVAGFLFIHYSFPFSMVSSKCCYSPWRHQTSEPFTKKIQIKFIGLPNLYLHLPYDFCCCGERKNRVITYRWF